MGVLWQGDGLVAPPRLKPWPFHQHAFYQFSDACGGSIFKGRVLVTPTGKWASCKPTECKEGQLVVFPDGMTCTWDVTEAIEKCYNFS